jgi:hypothetical protein
MKKLPQLLIGLVFILIPGYLMYRYNSLFLSFLIVLAGLIILFLLSVGVLFIALVITDREVSLETDAEKIKKEVRGEYEKRKKTKE